jgi:hypothetical protein
MHAHVHCCAQKSRWRRGLSTRHCHPIGLRSPHISAPELRVEHGVTRKACSWLSLAWQQARGAKKTVSDTLEDLTGDGTSDQALALTTTEVGLSVSPTSPMAVALGRVTCHGMAARPLLISPTIALGVAPATRDIAERGMWPPSCLEGARPSPSSAGACTWRCDHSCVDTTGTRSSLYACLCALRQSLFTRSEPLHPPMPRRHMRSAYSHHHTLHPLGVPREGVKGLAGGGRGQVGKAEARDASSATVGCAG